MADPGFLQLELSVSIAPAVALLNSLNEMLKVNSSAVLNVKGNKIQIVANTPDGAYFTTHDTLSSFIFANWNPPHGCAIQIELITWVRRLTVPITQQPLSSVYIFKPPGSASLQFRFGNTRQVIELGAFHFMQQNRVDMNNFSCKVRVIISSESFREAIQAFISQHDSVILDINRRTRIRWIAPSGDQKTHPAVLDFTCPSITPSDLQLQMNWTWPSNDVISSVLKCYEIVEISVLTDIHGIYWHHFRFSARSHSNRFCYMEKRPRPN